MKLYQLTHELEKLAPLPYQESYDNAGLIVGSNDKDISKALICFDVTEEVIEEAVNIGADIIISHHPIIFKGLKKLNGKNYVERVVIEAIKNDIALYAIHTNLDNVVRGTNSILANKLGLKNIKILDPLKARLKKIVTYCPIDHADSVRQELFNMGGGRIGHYDQCSFNVQGKGTFRAGDQAQPFVGKHGETHTEDEVRIEMVFPDFLERSMISALKKSHPYEEVAYDIYRLENEYSEIGAGVIGELDVEMNEMSFLIKLKKLTNAGSVRYTELLDKPIKNVALCGGSGAFLINRAKQSKADIYITGDVKYHEFFDSEREMVIADIGHYESEQFTKELLISYIKEKFPTFAVQISDKDKNPINYL